VDSTAIVTTTEGLGAEPRSNIASALAHVKSGHGARFNIVLFAASLTTISSYHWDSRLLLGLKLAFVWSYS
jgi:hypothetical protein